MLSKGQMQGDKVSFPLTVVKKRPFEQFYFKIRRNARTITTYQKKIILILYYLFIYFFFVHNNLYKEHKQV